MEKVLSEIQKIFLDEANNSPMLFSDLANMEKYISESYSGRSLIELLQNADDASANKFYIEELDDSTYIVANNGREFSDDDIIALCRSGASNKKRKSNTIGFRGIGFKSVVNYAEIVHLISGDIKATFSRTLTKKKNPNFKEVPLIRVPHDFEGNQYMPIINKILENGYTTIFIFESKNTALANEIQEFNSSCMLFLKSITQIVFKADINLEYKIYRKKQNSQFSIVTIDDKGKKRMWITTIPTIEDEKCSIAWEVENGKAKKLSAREAVVHSFMPTLNTLSMGIKVNGDFSTDPSRMRVVMDEETKKAAKICGRILSQILVNIIETEKDEWGLAQLLKLSKIDPLHNIKGEDVNDLIVVEFQKNFMNALNRLHGNYFNIYIQPKGITDEDFIKIIKNIKAIGYSCALEQKIPEILNCLKAMGIEELPVDLCLSAMNNLECSDSTRASVLAKVINQTRFGMDSELEEKIKEAKLFRFNSGIKKLGDVSEHDLVEEGFEGAIIELISSTSDYNAFAKKVGLTSEQLSINSGNNKEIHVKLHHTENTENIKSFGGSNSIKKWRSGEKNLIAVLKMMKGIQQVNDVSTQNIGYDLETVMQDGSRRFYEVKSVDRLGDLVSITNNEYSTASELGDRYYLAIVCQTETSFEVCFVKNPVNILNLSRRATRWEWICNEYEGELIQLNI